MQRRSDSGPAAPVEISISEVPVAPVTLSFDSGPQLREPGARAIRRPARASRTRRLAGWALDLVLVGSLFAAHVVLAVRVAGVPWRGPGLVLAEPWLWLFLFGGLALAWSWTSVALCGRTPGMALTRQRLCMLEGGSPTAVLAFVRALLAVVCAAPALFGFVLALFDTRGQTLHDKLCGCLAIVD
jgi:uncharacterized RDD family membrane protein YckC